MSETQTRTIQEIEHSHTLAMSEVKAILDLIQATTDNGTEDNLQPGTISSAADGAMRALEASQDIFEELVTKWNETEEVQP